MTSAGDGDVGAWADNLHANSPSRRIAVSEYGAGANVSQHVLNPPYQPLFHEAADTVAVTATVNGSTYTDSVIWTLG